MTWKDSFEKIKAELDLIERKKQTLSDLRDSGRISQFAYECLNKELRDETGNIEARRKTLIEKMTRKLNELEEQRITLELFFANNEMAYVAGEIDGELYAKQSNTLDLGLETTKQELSWIKEIIVGLVPKENSSADESTQTVTAVETAEASTDAVVEKPEMASSVPTEVHSEITASQTEVTIEPAQTTIESTNSARTSEEGEEPIRTQNGDTPT